MAIILAQRIKSVAQQSLESRSPRVYFLGDRLPYILVDLAKSSSHGE